MIAKSVNFVTPPPPPLPLSTATLQHYIQTTEQEEEKAGNGRENLSTRRLRSSFLNYAAANFGRP